MGTDLTLMCTCTQIKGSFASHLLLSTKVRVSQLIRSCSTEGRGRGEGGVLSRRRREGESCVVLAQFCNEFVSCRN